MNWYALRVRSNREKTVADAINRIGLVAFLPTYRQETRWSDRLKVAYRPLFPGYLFVNCQAAQLSRVVQLAGVVGLLPSNLSPAVIPAAEIGNLSILMDTRVPVEHCEYEPGEVVEVDQGPLAGLRGPVIRVKDGYRIVVQVEIMRRAVSVEIDAGNLKSVKA